jgi:hypothetical protein
MAVAAAPLFADPIMLVVGLVLTIAAVITEIVAFVHCLTQRHDAFAAINTLSKGIWLALLGGSMFLSLLLGFNPVTSIFGIIGLVAALVYLLDIRPALRDAVNGAGGW